MTTGTNGTTKRCDRLLLAAVWIVCVFGVPPALGAGGSAPGLAEVIANHCRAREATTALEAQFIETKVFTVFGEEETSKGTLFFGQPDRVCWRYSEPDQSSTVINGESGWSVFPGIKQIQKFELEGSKTDKVLSIVGFGRCATPLTESFDITMTIEKKGGFVLAMKPTDDDITPYFSRIDLTLDRKDYLPRKIELFETSGDVLIFEFSELDRDVDLDESIFEYVVPNGYEVVEY
jgi:outer membrane lipoprotein carrier protein